MTRRSYNPYNGFLYDAVIATALALNASIPELQAGTFIKRHANQCGNYEYSSDMNKKVDPV